MRPREFLLLSTAAALLGIAGLAWFGHETFAGTEPPPGVDATAPSPAGDPGSDPGRDPASDPGGDPGSDPDGRVSRPDPVAVQLPAAPVPATTSAPIARVDTAPRTSGLVRGDIQLAVSALPRIRSIRVEIVEVRNPTATNKNLPTRLIREVTMGRGTPTFEIDDVPFSEYPYRVSVWSPGLNGNGRTITVNAKENVVDGVLLTITPGTPLSVLVRDQDAAPYIGLDLAMLPIGEPAGRHAMKGTTDNGGGLVFDDVLAGDYQVLATQNGLPVIEPQTMHVNEGSLGAIRGQSYPLLIERGVPVQVRVHDRNFYPYVGAKVVATATDRVRLTVREATTDASGIAAFAHLQAGTWQISVTQDKCYRWDQQITVKPYQDPIVIDAAMAPVR